MPLALSSGLCKNKEVKLEHKIFGVDTCSESVKEVLERVDGLTYDDSTYLATYEGIVYDVFQCEVIGVDVGNIVFYRLVA